jgi:C4-dicarboxylate transporter, DctM subunit
LILLLFIVMGCILDAMAMIFLLVPNTYPVLMQIGFDLI